MKNKIERVYGVFELNKSRTSSWLRNFVEYHTQPWLYKVFNFISKHDLLRIGL